MKAEPDADGENNFEGDGSSLSAKIELKLVPYVENSTEEGDDGSTFSEKIAELEHRLRKEKSDSELARLSASHEIDRCKRECVSLKENVARLKEDCEIFREREVEDRERIESLLEEIERKERWFNQKFVEHKVEIRDLEFGKKKAHSEVLEWKKKYGELEDRAMGLVDEAVVEIERTEIELEEKSAVLEREKRDLERAKRRVQDEVREWKEKYGELEARELRLAKENFRLIGKEEEGRGLREKFVELEAAYKDLAYANNRAQDEVQEWKEKYGELEARELRLVEENSRLIGIEKTASELMENFLELETKNKDLNRGKRRAQDKVLELSKRYGELEARESGLVKKNSRLVRIEQRERELKQKLIVLEEENRDLVCQKKEAWEEVLEWKKKYGELKDQQLRFVVENYRLKEFKKEERALREKFVKLEEENRDLVCEKQEAQDEVQKWKQKFEELKAQVLKSVEEEQSSERNRSQNSSKPCEGSMSMDIINSKSVIDFNEELLERNSHFKQKNSEVLLLTSGTNKKHAFEHNNEDENGVDNYVDKVYGNPVSQKRKRGWEGDDSGKKASDSSQTHYYGYMTSSWRRPIFLHPCEVGKFEAKRTCADEVADVQVPSFPANNGQQVGLHSFLKRNSMGQEDSGRVASSEEQFAAVKRAEKLLSKLNANHPSFVKSVVWIHVSGGCWFVFPSNFREVHLPAHDLTMILEDEKGLEQKVNYSGDGGHFSDGWKDFALSHCLEIGDALVFELTEPTRFKVYILKPVRIKLEIVDGEIAEELLPVGK